MGGIWADFGAGDGAFTLAVAELIGPGGTVYAVDRDARALMGLRRASSGLQPPPLLHEIVADFTQPLKLPPLDGALVANALHYIGDASATLKLLTGYLRASAALVVVEYDTTRAGPWVPHPLPFARLRELCEMANTPPPRLLGRAPSLYHGVIYAASLSPHG
jgi:ubiquinone/menaquinone biosynthesis C-methylase UbiE